MKNLNEIMTDAGYTKETLIDVILDKIEADGVKLEEFNDDQKNRIIVSYAARILA